MREVGGALMPERNQTVAGAYDRINSHEARCDERYKTINWKLNLLVSVMITMIGALLGWALLEVYTLQPLRTETVAHTVSQSYPQPGN